MNTKGLRWRASRLMLVSLFSLLFQSGSLLGASAYEFQIVAQSGEMGLTSILGAPSINDSGNVAFVGQLSTGQGLFVDDGSGTPINIAAVLTGDTRSFNSYLQINNANQIVAQDLVAGSPPEYFVRLWNLAGQSSTTIGQSAAPRLCTGGINGGKQCTSDAHCPPAPGFCVGGIPSLCLSSGECPPFISPTGIIVSSSCVGVRPGRCPTSVGFFSVLAPSVNNLGQTVHVGLNGDQLTLVAANGAQKPLSGNFLPMLADDGSIIGKEGTAVNAPIRRYSSDLSSFQEIASSANGFTETGSRPTVSDDGSVVAFYGADAQGPGVFAMKANTLYRVASLADGFSAFNTDSRLGVSGALTDNRAKIVYLATVEGKEGLYSRTINFSDGTVENPELIVQAGVPLTGVNGTVQSISIHDPLNSRGEIACLVTMESGTQVILTVRERQQIILRRVTQATVDAMGGVDTALAIKAPPAISLQALSKEPEVQKGLVADGVTPLLIEFHPNPAPTQPTTYAITFSTHDGSILNRTLSQRLHVLDSNGWTVPAIPNITLSPSTPIGYLYIEGIDVEEVRFRTDPRDVELTATVVFSSPGHATVTRDFGIRKPPIVLVHGYNADNTTWTETFLRRLDDARGADFIIPTSYAPKSENTPDSLESLASKLNHVLSGIDGGGSSILRKEWAFTRYDVVGHSQGGVLLRMLCATNPFDGVKPFKSAENFYRGRFGRIITIGSPHNGSTLAYFLSQTYEKFSSIYAALPGILKNELVGVLQPKFNPFGEEIRKINDPSRVIDPAARFHLITATINGGRVDASKVPLCYFLPGLTQPALVPTDLQPLRGNVVLPRGSDGVVDLDSQEGGIGSKTSHLDSDTSHAPPVPESLESLFGVGADKTETRDPAVAGRVLSLLDGPKSEFQPFVLPARLDSERRWEIDFEVPIGALYDIISSFLPRSGPQQAAAVVTEKNSDDGVTAYSYVVTPPDSELVTGDIAWHVEVYGPDGVTTKGVSIAANATDVTKVTVNVDAAVQGDVVLYASYISKTGKMVIGRPVVVTSRPVGPKLEAIELQPGLANAAVGDRLFFTVWGTYENGVKSQLFIPPSTAAQFQSSNPSIVEVSAGGVASVVKAGTASIAVSYNGLTATAAIAAAGYPLISTQPESQAVFLDTTVTFSVVVEGGALSYQWQKNGINIQGATSASYTIVSARAGDAGSYTVVVSNASGSISSSVATLTINKKAPFLEPVFGFKRAAGQPESSLVSDGRGNFWGTTRRGGASDSGTIFKVNASTGELTVVYEFSDKNGRYPSGGLVSDGEGNVWGTAQFGGTFSNGTVFKVDTITGAMTTVANFTNTGAANRGRYPQTGLVNDGAGNLWGTTHGGGASDCGTLFKIRIGTGTLTTVVDFGVNNVQGAHPSTVLTNDAAGYLWGTTENSIRGSALTSYGTVFKINVATGEFATVIAFGGTDLVSRPTQAFTPDGAGNLWSIVNGWLVKIDAAKGVLTYVTQFGNDNLYSDLLSDGSGRLWGTTQYGGMAGAGTVFYVDTTSGQQTTVASFSGDFDTNSTGTGAAPYALVSDGVGNLWGTTTRDGRSGGAGTIFKMSADTYTLETVANFSRTGVLRGANFPVGALVDDGTGILWGATRYSSDRNFTSGGQGTIFKFEPAKGTASIAIEFDDNVIKGASPNGGLVDDGAGNLWGCTSGGGSSGRGTIFRIKKNSVEFTTVAAFLGYNGANPTGGLVRDGSGNFWGVTSAGGTNDGGTVFKLEPSTGTLTAIVDFGFVAGAGRTPVGTLINDSAGNLWGVTSAGGANGTGTVFKVDVATGQLTTISNFASNGLGYPSGGLVSDGLGNFYGVAGRVYYIQNYPYGEPGYIYKVNSSTGALSEVYRFRGSDGCFPQATLVSDGAGNLWGTTQFGGTGWNTYLYQPDTGNGTVFKINQATGVFTTVFEFNEPLGSYWGPSKPIVSGVAPSGELFLASDGNLYGVTSRGGATANGEPAGGGEIFRIRFGHAVQTSVSSAGGGSASGSGTYVAGDSVTVVATADSGYTFVHWTEDGAIVSTSAFYTFTMSGSRKLIANFTPIVHTLTVNAFPSAGGSVSGGGSFNEGSSRTVTATANSGYTFTNWSENGAVVSTSPQYSFTVNARRNLVATFVQNASSYSIVLSASPSHAGSVGGGGNFSAGSSRTVTATAASGYKFSNWTEVWAGYEEVVSTTPSYTFTLERSRSLVAHFLQLPTILVQPTGRTVTVGDSVSFSVEAVGPGALSYQWKKDGNAIAGATSASYRIEAAQYQDAGSYTVVVTNAAGSTVSDLAVLAVNPPEGYPHITQQPQSRTVTAGEGVTFTVQATGAGILSYQWSKNGTAITGATSAGFTVENAQRSDRGTYSVTVSNAIGSVTSSGALLRVNLPNGPNLMAETMVVSTVKGTGTDTNPLLSGDPLYVHWWVKNSGSSSSPTVSLRLYVDGVLRGNWANSSPISPGSYIHVKDHSLGTLSPGTHTLRLIADVNDSVGETNEDDNEYTKTITVLAAGFPVIRTQPKDQMAVSGADVTFSVAVDGQAPLTYHWYKDGVIIPGTNGATLLITGVQPFDAGRYAVKVNNTVGEVLSRDAFLTVLLEGAGGDSVAQATLLRGAVVRVRANNEAASRKSEEPQLSEYQTGKTVWWKWSAPQTGPVLIDTLGSNISTVIGVFAGDDTNALEPVALNGTFRKAKTSRLQFTASKQRTYYIATDGAFGQSGEILLTLRYKAAGIYRGLVTPVELEKVSGSMSVVLNSSLSYSGKLALSGRTYRFKGRFDQEQKTHSLRRGKGLPPMNLSLHLDLSPGSSEIIGSLEDGDVHYEVRTIRNAVRVDIPVELTGTYQVTLTPTAGSNVDSSQSLLTLTRKGGIKLRGVLGDGRKLNVNSALSLDYSWPLWAVPYKGESVAGIIELGGAEGVAWWGGTVRWVKPPNPKNKDFPNGFSLEADILGTR